MSFVRVIDTMCDGWQCEKDQHGNPFTYEKKEEAQRELNADFQESVSYTHLRAHET